MKRSVLGIPWSEINAHFRLNERKDVKIVVPEMLTEELRQQLLGRKKMVREEQSLDGDLWKHAGPHDPYWVCEAGDFSCDPCPEGGDPFTISVALPEAAQEAHYHARHCEIFISEHPISAAYRHRQAAAPQEIVLESGGVLIFGPEVIHAMTITGLTLVIECPAVRGDRYTAPVSIDGYLNKNP